MEARKSSNENMGKEAHAAGDGMKDSKNVIFKHYFTKPSTHPFEEIEWELREAVILNDKGGEVFRQEDVEVPGFWSQNATNIVASKYFAGTLGGDDRERSAKQLISRVARTIASWGRKDKYFVSEEESQIFESELIFLLINQYAAFNSPVWFNCGVHKKPQCSACFINSITDSMDSILELTKTEGMLFKFGSGTGTNFSNLRASMEGLSSGGTASGPVSFMRGFDAFAGVIKSGGTTRRAAKMVILNVEHPDIMAFVKCKAEEEKKAWALIDAGYDGGFNVPGGAYDSVQFQNANHSVRVSDDFMDAVVADGDWKTQYVNPDSYKRLPPPPLYKAKELMKAISEAAHLCGDPGIQFDTTINAWNTCMDKHRINASNPCSEYMFLDNSACNLASLNLMKFRKSRGGFDTESFCNAVRVIATAQEIIVDNAGYPTKEIGKNSSDYRALGLGYANLGALLMSLGLPYDSDEGRNYASAVTSLMTGYAYKVSAEIAERQGTFKYYPYNQGSFSNVMEKHKECAHNTGTDGVPAPLINASRKAWDDAVEAGEQFGFRNAQVSVLAPTGTIGFMMDCDTTGIEPDIAIVKYKKLVGGGVMKIVNGTVPLALKNLGYRQKQVDEIMEYINEHDTIEDSPHLDEKHLAVFDCAFRPAKGKRSIHYMGHVRMMAAAQPFISGAISKTVNMPHETTMEEIMETYVQAWKLGLKSIAIYRDGCKRTQPLTTSAGGSGTAEAKKDEGPIVRRKHLPDERPSLTHKFSVGGHEGYITVGMFDDGTPGELFVVMAKQGSTVSGLMDSFAVTVSMALQYGVPLRSLVRKLSHARFEPAGFTTNPQIRIAKSLTDYIARWLALKFLSDDEKKEMGISTSESKAVQTAVTTFGEGGNGSESGQNNSQFQVDAPPCHECGAIMVRSGSCYKCYNCGATSGCS